MKRCHACGQPLKAPRQLSALALGEAFDQFWAKYPRKVGKVEACKAFAKLDPDESLIATILEALDWQSKQPQWTKDGGVYVPYAATWLRGERWTDERPAASRPRQTLDWSAECRDLHGGRCGNVHMHAARMAS